MKLRVDIFMSAKENYVRSKMKISMTLNAASFATFCHYLPVTLSQFLLGVIFGNEVSTNK